MFDFVNTLQHDYESDTRYAQNVTIKAGKGTRAAARIRFENQWKKLALGLTKILAPPSSPPFT